MKVSDKNGLNFLCIAPHAAKQTFQAEKNRQDQLKLVFVTLQMFLICCANFFNIYTYNDIENVIKCNKNTLNDCRMHEFSKW